MAQIKVTLSVCFSLLLCVIVKNAAAEWLDRTCQKRYYNKSSFVCVCDRKGCDFSQPAEILPKGHFFMSVSDIDTYRHNVSERLFEKSTHHKNTSSLVDVEITIDNKKHFQRIYGFGGAFSDAAGFNILSLTDNLQDLILASYFTSQGNSFNMGRVPMGGVDFSWRPYSYDDIPDDHGLEQYHLQYEDRVLKIPLIKKADHFSEDDLWLVATAWSAPDWMKVRGKGKDNKLKPENYQVWADYHLKFFDYYRARGIDFWAVTTGNEPVLTSEFDQQTPYFMAWSKEDLTKYIANNLGPTLRNCTAHNDVKILILDDSRRLLPEWPKEIYKNEEAAKYIYGTAVHWYHDSDTPAGVLSETHDLKPDKHIIYTESCQGFPDENGPNPDQVSMGNWERAENYARNIIENINNWVSAWIEWNLALNEIGGPNFAKNPTDAMIIVNRTSNEFYKQPMFYAIGHFSKYISRNSRRVVHNVTVLAEDLKEDDVVMTAVMRPDFGTVLVIHNGANRDVNISFTDHWRSSKAHVTLLKRSISTIVYW